MAIAECSDIKPNLTLVAAAPAGSRGHRSDAREPVLARPSITQWLWFAGQLLAIAALQFGDDVVRGNINPPDMHQAVLRARAVASFEQAHGFFVEPALQLWLRHGHTVFGILSYSGVVRLTDVVYALGQTLVPLLLAVWIFLRRRSRFPLVRDIALLSTFLALVGYELFPTAPPRLTSGLMYHHHFFSFHDTMQHVIGDGTINGIPLGYNAYSAIPSLHITWALIVAGSLIVLAHHPLVRLLAGAYPLLMLFTVVFSGNHFLLDAAAGALAAALATLVALIREGSRQKNLDQVRKESQQ